VIPLLRFSFIPLSLSVALFTAKPAGAQPSDSMQLFTEGSAMMEQGQFAEALPLLERAQKAQPGIGTMFNIAICHQKLGRLGTAYRKFREVEQLARASGKQARADAAHEKLAEIKARVPAFAIATSDPDEVTVRVDGDALRKDEWSFYPIDPGEHRIEAIAAAKKPWTATFPTPAEGKVEPITIPVLDVAKDTKVITVTKETTSGRRTLGFILGGVGLAGVVTASVTGILLISDHATTNEKCPNKVCRNPDGTVNEEGKDAVDRGRILLPVNAIAWGVAAVGLGAGAFFLLTSGKKSEPAKTAFVPYADVTSGGASLVGSF